MSLNQDLGPTYYTKHITVIAVFSGVASVAVGLRFWARRIQNMSLELNDYLVVLGLVFALAESAINIYGCCFGMAKQMNQGDIQKAIIFSQKSQFMVPIIWVASITFIRASIVFLYIRVFPTRIFRRICYVVLTINYLFFIGTCLADCLICQPIAYRWDQMTGGSGHCGDQKSLDLFIGIFNLLLDATVVVLPMPILWGLKMAVAKKVMLSGMFGMGTVICGITIWRIYDTTTISSANAQDVYALIALLTSLEVLLGVTNACLPVLKPIFNKLRGTAPKSSSGGAVSEILKSGTIPIFMRVSQMWTLASRKGKDVSSDEETLTEWYGEKRGNSGAGAGVEGGGDMKEPSVSAKEISSPITQKAERVLGLKPQEIHVRREVEVESVISRDDLGAGGEGWEGWEGRQERW